MDQKHYICLGDCEGVSDKPGVCEAVQCENYQHPLVECDCTDGAHRHLKLPETDEED